MNKKIKVNNKIKMNFVIVGIIIILVILSAISIINKFESKKTYFELNGVKISTSDYQAIQKNFASSYSLVRLCNLDNQQCIVMKNVNGGNPSLSSASGGGG